MDEVLDRLPGGFLTFRDDGLIIATNRTLLEMLGYGDGGLSGGSIEALLTLPSRIFYQTHLFPLLKIQDRVDEIYLTLRTRSGEGLPVLLNARTIPTGTGAQHECLIIPMQSRDKYEEEILHAKRVAEQAVEELEGLKASLEERVRERTSDLKQLLSELNGLNYSIAHNLRAPMRAILSTSAVLRSEYPGSLSEDQINLLDRQKLNVETLSSLIDDLLQLSRIGIQLPVKEQIDVSSLAMQAAVEAVADRQAEFTLSICPGVTAWADPNMIATVCAGLMSNAVKYSPRGGTITFCGQQNGAEIVCFVKDEGIGMDPQHIHHIFEPFARLHGEEFPGNGIGLAVVDRIIRHHGGKVWVESEVGKGSTFLFALPDSN